jgi:hypothetical protein
VQFVHVASGAFVAATMPPVPAAQTSPKHFARPVVLAKVPAAHAMQEAAPVAGWW